MSYTALMATQNTMQKVIGEGNQNAPQGHEEGSRLNPVAKEFFQVDIFRKRSVRTPHEDTSRIESGTSLQDLYVAPEHRVPYRTSQTMNSS
jgi:hypothetical protein